VHIYIIGDWLGTGVQFPLFRYQETIFGKSFITITREMAYFYLGILKGKSVLSTSIWILGASLLVLACILAVFHPAVRTRRIRGGLLVGGAVLLLLSLLIHYGPLLSGPAGLSIPVGVPVLVVIGVVLAGGDEEVEPPGS
jgi:hypothetical protein